MGVGGCQKSETAPSFIPAGDKPPPQSCCVVCGRRQDGLFVAVPAQETLI